MYIMNRLSNFIPCSLLRLRWLFCVNRTQHLDMRQSIHIELQRLNKQWLREIRRSAVRRFLCFDGFVFSPCMMTSSNGNIFRVTGPLCGEFTGHRWIPLTKASDSEVLMFFFDLRLNKRLIKQSRRWWFQVPSRSLWRHCNGTENYDFVSTYNPHNPFSSYQIVSGLCNDYRTTCQHWYVAYKNNHYIYRSVQKTCVVGCETRTETNSQVLLFSIDYEASCGVRQGSWFCESFGTPCVPSNVTVEA